MKRIYLLCFMIFVTGLQYGSAQWTSDITVNTPTSTMFLQSSDQPKVTAGKTTGSFVTWVQYDTTVSKRTCLYAQAFDKNGNRLWTDKGVLVDSLMGLTRYKYDQKVDNNGDFIIGTQNTRVNSFNQYPVIYKLDRNTGKMLWKREFTDTPRVYLGLSPSLSITSNNNILVGWSNIRVLPDSSETVDACIQKISGDSGKVLFLNPLIITDNTNYYGFSVPQMIPSGSIGENFMVAYQMKSNKAGLVPYNILVQRYNGASAIPTPYWAKPTSVASSHLLVTGNTVNMMTDGGTGLVMTYPVAGKYGGEVYGQYVDFSGNAKWGADALLLATTTEGSANVCGASFDPVNRSLWFSIFQDHITTGTSTRSVYMQGVDANGNFLRPGYTTGGMVVLPANQVGTNANALTPINMKSTGDGFIITYAQGILPTPTVVKAVKIDTVGHKLWPAEDSVIIVSSRQGLAGATVSDFVDNQLVMSMIAIPDGSFRGRSYQLAQNINTIGTVGVNTQRQVVNFNTDTLYVVYGDAPYALNATSSSGMTPIYTVSDPAKGMVDENGYVHFLDVGTFTVAPYFPPNSTYMAKQGRQKVFIVTKGRTLKVIADSNTKQYGWMLPTLTMHFETFANGDDAYSAFTKLPTIYCAATKDSPVGVYPITLQGGVSSKYFIQLVNAQLTVYPQGGKDKNNMDVYCSSPSVLQVIIYSLENNNGPLQLIDMGGRVLWTSAVSVVPGVNNFQIPVGALSGGIYIIRFAGKNKMDLNQKVRIK